MQTRFLAQQHASAAPDTTICATPRGAQWAMLQPTAHVQRLRLPADCVSLCPGSSHISRRRRTGTRLRAMAEVTASKQKVCTTTATVAALRRQTHMHAPMSLAIMVSRTTPQPLSKSLQQSLRMLQAATGNNGDAGSSRRLVLTLGLLAGPQVYSSLQLGQPRVSAAD